MRHIFTIIAFILKRFSTLMEHWLILLVVASYVTGIGPALRTDYSYTPVYGGKRLYHACDYLAVTGRFTWRTPQSCPVIVITNAKGQRVL